jgi:type II secretory pathway predicted ATPase ExeA
LSRKGLILLSGSVGTGKTILLNTALQLLKESSGGRRATRTAVLVHPTLTREEFVEAILAGFQIPFMATRKTQRWQLLREMLYDVQRKGGFAVLAIDEAQLLSPELLDEIRVLRGLQAVGPEGFLQIILCGQPDLEEKLKRSTLSQLQDSITVRCETAPLSSQETRDYIRHRLIVAGARPESILTGEAADAIHFHARGIPRIVNLLCAQVLAIAGHRGIRGVTPQMVDEAAAKMLFNGLNPPRRRLRWPRSGSTDLAQPAARAASPAESALPTADWAPQPIIQSPIPLTARPASASSGKQPLVFAPKPVARVSTVPRRSPPVRNGWLRFSGLWSGNLARKKYWLFFFCLFLAGTLLLTLAQVAWSQPTEQRARATCGFLGLLLVDSSLGVATYLYFDERRLRLAVQSVAPPKRLAARRSRQLELRSASPHPPRFVRMPGDKRATRRMRAHKVFVHPPAR